MKLNRDNTLTVTFLYFDKINENGRIYPKELVGTIIADYAKLIKDGSSFGCLGYRETFEIPLYRVSHRIKSIYYNSMKNSLDGVVEILQTPEGKKVFKNLNKNIKNKESFSCVFRPCGSGEINENKEVTNYKLYSFDIVPEDVDSFKNLRDKNDLIIKK